MIVCGRKNKSLKKKKHLIQIYKRTNLSCQSILSEVAFFILKKKEEKKTL